jgi:beta-barrel assembly-enhancing protease
MRSTWGPCRLMEPTNVIRVWHYDGASGIRYEPELLDEGAQFRLKLAEGMGAPHLWSELVFASAKGADPVYGLEGRRGWRMGFSDPVPAHLAAKLPKAIKYGGVIDRVGLWPASIAFVALSAIAVFVGIKAPDLLAPLVPASFEQKMGDAMVGDFGGRVCNGPGGQDALNALVRKIEPKPEGLKVRVVNIDMVNAVALPGGNVFVFRGLLQSAQSPDELAGVVGHEIGHVRNRDVMEALLRQMGVSILLGGANSDVSGSLNAVVSSTYSRGAEAKADDYAIRAMKQSHVSPLDTAAFFDRLAERDKVPGAAKTALSYLSSHPLSEEREKKFRKSAASGAAYSPALTAEQWRALVDSCKNDPDVEQDDGLLF